MADPDSGLRIHPEALSAIPKQDVDRIIKKIEWLWANRRLVTHHPLSANLSGFLKKRVSGYRIIYTYENDADRLVVYLAGTRDEIYQEAAKRLD